MPTRKKHTAESTLEERIKRLEEIEAIRKMKAEYVLACDERRWDDAMRYFASRAVVAFGPFGKFESRQELENFFQGNDAGDDQFHNSSSVESDHRSEGRYGKGNLVLRDPVNTYPYKQSDPAARNLLRRIHQGEQ